MNQNFNNCIATGTYGADTITFAFPYGAGTIALHSQLPTITDELVIDGSTMSPHAVTVSGQNAFSVFVAAVANAGENVTLRRLIIRDGGGADAAIRNLSAVSLISIRESSVGFPEEYAKFLAVALPWLISGTSVSHLLVSLTS
jgi:hypothetical protein